MAPSDFFDRQFRKQVAEGSFELNPFETLALGYLDGSILDLGAGLGNLALEAGRRGCKVLAVEKSRTAVRRITRDAAREQLPVTALEADILTWTPDRDFDTILCIGLLMFFREAQAWGLLEMMKAHLRPGGRLILNVLIEGTTFMDMFEGGEYHLFGEGEIEAQLPDWEILESLRHGFDAPHASRKEFLTIVARKPLV